MNTSLLSQTNANEKTGGGGRNINLHPLAIISISDHFTRVSVGAAVEGSIQKILGLLFGVQEGREVSIYDSCEVLCTLKPDGGVQLDAQSIVLKIELFTAVFPTYELLGWYSVNKELLPDDLDIQRSLLTFNESPLFLLMNPSPLQSEGKKELPLSIYESELHLVQERPTFLFVRLDYNLRAAQAEQISVEQVSRSNPAEGASSVEAHLRGVNTSLTTLHSRLGTLAAYLEMIKEGKLPTDHRLLRQIDSICETLSAKDSKEFRSNFGNEYNDTLMVTCLAGITKSTNALNDVADKYLVAFEDKHRRGV